MVKPSFPFVAMIMFVGLTSVNWSPKEMGIHLSDPASVKSHGTTLVPVLDGPIPKGRNVLWCATFQMAWDGAGKRLGPLRLQPVSKLADSLNKNPFDPSWVDERSVFISEGRVNEGVLDRIEDGVRARGGHSSKLVHDLERSSAADDLVFFAMLHKELQFEKPFGKLGSWALGGRKVPWFGFTPQQQGTGPLRSQVRVHRYATRNDFIVEILAKEPGDQLLLAKFPKSPDSLGKISANLLSHLQARAPQAGENDLIAIPHVVAEEVAEFSELQGRRVQGSQWVLRKAMQRIDFREAPERSGG